MVTVILSGREIFALIDVNLIHNNKNICNKTGLKYHSGINWLQKMRICTHIHTYIHGWTRALCNFVWVNEKWHSDSLNYGTFKVQEIFQANTDMYVDLAYYLPNINVFYLSESNDLELQNHWNFTVNYADWCFSVLNQHFDRNRNFTWSEISLEHVTKIVLKNGEKC